MSEKILTCPNSACRHVWVARKEGGAKRCPKCQTLLEGFKEGIVPPSPPIAPLVSMDEKRIDFSPQVILSNEKFATTTDEEWQKIEEEAVRDYKRYLKELRVFIKERRRQTIVELAGRIAAAGRGTSRMWHLESIPTLKTQLATIRRRSIVENKRIKPLDKLKSLESRDEEAELEKWLEKTASSRRTLGRAHYPKEEDFIKELKQDTEIVKLAIPILREIVAVYDERIAELKQAEVEVAPLVKDANAIRKKAVKPTEEESMFIDAMCDADERHPEKLDDLLTSYRKVNKKVNKLEDEYREICNKINEKRIDPPELLSFPPRKLVKLKLRERIIRKLAG